MALDFQQTNIAGTCGTPLVCAGGTPNGITATREGVDTGTPGTIEVSITMDISAADKRAVWLECHSWPAGTTGDAGTWTVRLNVTTGNGFIDWDQVHICQVNSACANIATIGSTTGLGISLMTTGVKTATVTGAAVTLADTDKVLLILSFDNGQAMTQAFGWTPSELISSPFTAPAVGYQNPVHDGLFVMPPKIPLWRRKPIPRRFPAFTQPRPIGA